MAVTGAQLIEEFVNTLHKNPNVADEDRLTSPAELSAWLATSGITEPVRAAAANLLHAMTLREALRVLLLANNGSEGDTQAAWAVLDATARRARIEVRFAQGEPTLAATADGVNGALGHIVVAVYDTITDGTWPRLKACRAHDCEWAFFDNAKNQSRTWCSMSSCGNREKARAFRERQKTSAR